MTSLYAGNRQGPNYRDQAKDFRACCSLSRISKSCPSFVAWKTSMISGPTWQSLIVAGFLTHLLAQHEHDAQHGAGQADDAGEVQEEVVTIGSIGHVEQLLAELLDGQLVENAMLAEADHDHVALLAKPQEVARRSAALMRGVFVRQGKASIRTAACDIAGSRHGRRKGSRSISGRPSSVAERPNRPLRPRLLLRLLLAPGR